MRVYTGTGDQGETGLIGNHRVSKTDLRIEAFGQLDELNSVIGIIQTHNPPEEIERLLERCQSWLFDVGAELASTDASFTSVQPSQSEVLERSMDSMTASLPPLRTFILPGGSPLAANLHLARTVCRRGERAVVHMSHQFPVRSEVSVFLNRLSDWFFVAARYANHVAQIEDVAWKKFEQ
jgi:cob(I)alamin adenosyltransferase